MTEVQREITVTVEDHDYRVALAFDDIDNFPYGRPVNVALIEDGSSVRCVWPRLTNRGNRRPPSVKVQHIISQAQLAALRQ